MVTNFSLDGSSLARIKRPPITTSGFVSDLDETIKSHLDELNELLGKRIFSKEISEDVLRATLAKPLTPKRATANDKWDDKSIADELKKAVPADDKITLSDYIDKTAELSTLKYAFQGDISADRLNLSYNAKAVLEDYPAIMDYLVAYGFHIMKLQEINGLKNFILRNNAGVKSVANYAIVSAARTIIDKEKLKVPDYDKDDSEIVAQIKSAGLLLSAASFKTGAKAVIDNFIFNSRESVLIDNAGIGEIPPGIKPQLIKFIKNSPVPITSENVKLFLPLFIIQIKGATQIADSTEVDREESDKDFSVQFLEDDDSLIQISRSAVLCSAQLYYGMVLGDELDVFNVANYFTHKYLVRGGITIEDSRLREDLQMYVFSNKFTDLKTKKIVDRTRPAERQLFYGQVFNYGNAQMTDDLIPNREFTKLWKVLILESAKYLEQARESPHPDRYVSRQNVMQAVEDLQYNLSTHSTGMANVITPLIYAELDFVIRQIFMHPEILRQVVPAGGTWWRVVETLYMGMKKARPKATVLYNKAKLGHDIIRSIADYNPTTFEDDKNFFAFISKVEAFITTQSILQEALTDDLIKGDEEEEEEQNGFRKPTTETAGASAESGSKGEWDF